MFAYGLLRQTCRRLVLLVVCYFLQIDCCMARTLKPNTSYVTLMNLRGKEVDAKSTVDVQTSRHRCVEIWRHAFWFSAIEGLELI